MTPLQFAIVSNDEKLFDTTLRCCSGMKFKVDEGIGDLSHGIFFMNSALTEAIKRENLYIVRKLVGYLVNFHTTKGSRYTPKGMRYIERYDDWMTLAVKAGNHHLAEALIPLRLKGGHVFLCDHFTTACRIGNLDLVSLIIRVAEMELDQEMDMPRHSPETLPLLYAVRWGKLDLILMIINARATVDECAQATALKYKHWHVFEYFRSLGDPLPTMDLWPRNMSRKMYHDLWELKIADGADRMTLPLHDTWKHMSRRALRLL
jgi:hypothetical protein